MVTDPIKWSRFAATTHTTVDHANDRRDLYPNITAALLEPHSWGIANGFAVTGLGTQTVTIGAGTAYDNSRRPVVLATKGRGDIGTNPAGGQQQQVPVPVALTTASLGATTCYLTVQHSTALDNTSGSSGRDVLTPWIRLLPALDTTGAPIPSIASLAEGTELVLAIVVTDTTGTITELQPSRLDLAHRRTTTGHTVGALRLLRPTTTTDVVGDTTAAILEPGTTRGLQITADLVVRSPTTGNPLLEITDTGDTNIAGNLVVDGTTELTGPVRLPNGATSANGATYSSDGRLHIATDERLFLLGKQGVHVSNTWGGSGDLTVDGTVTAASLRVQGPITLAGRDAVQDWSDGWLRLNQSGHYTAGVHTPGLFHPDSLNVGATNNPGSRNAAIAGNLRVDGTTELTGPVKLPNGATSANGATYSSNGRLHIATDERLFLLGKQGVHVSGAWGGAGDLTVDGTVSAGGLRLRGTIGIGGKDAVQDWSDGWLRLNQSGHFTAGVHTPGLLGPGSLNVGGYGGYVNPGYGNVAIGGSISYGGSLTKLDVTDQFEARVRVADFRMGTAQRRGKRAGMPDGRALVDNGDTLVVNFGRDWPYVHIDGMVRAILTNLSSRHLKHDIDVVTTEEAERVVAALEPVAFRFNDVDDQGLQLGFIAEDVPDVVATSDHRAIHGTAITAALVKVVQQQQVAIAELRRQLLDRVAS